MKRPPTEERVLVLAPTGGDAALSRTSLTEAGLTYHVCSDLDCLCRELDEGAGAVLLTEEVLAGNNLDCLAELIRQQPPWSEVPVLLLAGNGADSPVAGAAMDLLGNVMILERPVGVTTLASVLRAAVKARRQQYQFRDQMDSFPRTQETLRASEGTLRRQMERLSAGAYTWDPDPGGAVPGITCAAMDITRGKTLQAERDHLLQRHRLQIDRLPLAFLLMDADNRVLDWNPAAEEMFGYTREEALGRVALDLILPPPITDQVQEIVRRVRAGDMDAHSVNENRTKDGRIITCEWFNTPLMDWDGRFTGAISVAQDITERQRAEEKLRRSEALLAEAERLAHLGSWEWHIPSNTLTWSEELYQIFGLVPEEFPGTYEAFVGLVHPDDRERVTALLERVLQDGSLLEYSCRIVAPDGAVRIIHARGQVAIDGDGKAVRLRGACQDITERRRAEEALEESEGRFRAVFENALEPILLMDNSGRFVYGNSAACQLLGYSPEELLHRGLWDVTPVQERERIPKLLAQFLSAGTHSVDYTLLCKGGTIREVEYRAVANILPGLHLAVHRDVTERKQAGRALQESLNLLNAVIEGLPHTIYVKDLQGRYLMMNSPGARLIAKEVSEVVGRDDAALFKPETARRFLERDRRVMESGVTETDEETGTAAGVTRIYLTTRAPFRGLHGEVLGVLGISQDITDRKRAEEQLRRQKEVFESIIDHVPVMISFKDPAGRVQLVNRHWEEVLGWSLEEARNRDVFADLYPEPESRQLVLDRIHRAVPGWLDYKTRVRDGRILDTSWVNVLLSDGTNIGFGLDITERKREEQALRESEEQVRLLLNSTGEAIYGLDKDGRCTFCNPSCLRVLGYAESRELIGKNMHQMVHHTRAGGTPYPEKECRILRAFQQGEGTHVEDEVMWRADGTSFPTEYWSYPVRRGEQVIGVVVTFLDVSERRRVEEELRTLNAALENAVEGIARLDTQGRYLSANPAYAGMLGYQPEELVGRDWQPTVHPNDLKKIKAAHRRMLSEGRAEVEVRGMRKDHSAFWKQVVMVKAQDQQGQWTGYYCFMKDVSERKRADEALQEYASRLQALSARLVEVQEEERRHLSRELHDEIGQILATINFQLHAAKELAGAAALALLEDCGTLLQQAGDQVRSLALELRPTMLDTLGLEAALRWLAEHHQQRTGCEVQLVSYLSGVPLSPELMIACFRLVQEALTNIVRHAAARHVWIDLSQNESVLELAIHDDGVGFDVVTTQQQAVKRGSLGLLGMGERVLLLGGSLYLHSEPGRGTRIRASFPLAAPPDEASDRTE